jgi:hypothetical protein
MRTDFLSDRVCPRLSRIETFTVTPSVRRWRARAFRIVEAGRLSANVRRPWAPSRRVMAARRVYLPRPTNRAVVRETVIVTVARQADEQPRTSRARPRTVEALI